MDGTVDSGVGGGCEVGDEGGERGAVAEGGAEHGFVCQCWLLLLMRDGLIVIGSGKMREAKRMMLKVEWLKKVDGLSCKD